jgi:hypothetical protein
MRKGLFRTTQIKTPHRTNLFYACHNLELCIEQNCTMHTTNLYYETYSTKICIVQNITYSAKSGMVLMCLLFILHDLKAGIHFFQNSLRKVTPQGRRWG